MSNLNPSLTLVDVKLVVFGLYRLWMTQVYNWITHIASTQTLLKHVLLLHPGPSSHRTYLAGHVFNSSKSITVGVSVKSCFRSINQVQSSDFQIWSFMRHAVKFTFLILEF